MPALTPSHLGLALRELHRMIAEGSRGTVRDALACWLGLHGLRISEACNLRVGDLDHKREAIYVRTLKGGPSRQVPIDRQIFRHLAAIAAGRGADDYLLCTASGARLDPRNLRRRWSTLINRLAGRPYRFHDLRHTACRQVYERSGGNLIAAGYVLRHANISNTVIYLGDQASENVREWLTYVPPSCGDPTPEPPSPHENPPTRLA